MILTKTRKLLAGARSVPEDRLQTGKDRRKIQVRLRAHADVAAAMGIHRDDRFDAGVEITAHPDDAGIERAGRSPRERTIEGCRRGEFNQRDPSLRVTGPVRLAPSVVGPVGSGVRLVKAENPSKHGGLCVH
jgi:hypothetical protein